VPRVFKKFMIIAERESGKKIKILKLDGRTEFWNHQMDSILKENKIKRYKIHTSEQNSILELAYK